MPCICLSLRNAIKSNKSMGTHKACMGVGNLSTLTLKSTKGMGTSEDYVAEKEYHHYDVSGYYGVVLACS